MSNKMNFGIKDVIKYLHENAIFVNYDPLRERLIFNLTQIRTPDGCFSLDIDKVISMGCDNLIRELEVRKKCHDNC